MKNTTKILVALLMLSSVMNAQCIEVSLKGGTTLASPYVSITENGAFLARPVQKIRPGFYGGLSFNIPTLINKLHIQTELLFESAGSSFDSTEYNTSKSLTIQKLQVPLMVQYNIANLRINLGAYAGAILGVNEIADGVPISDAIFDYTDLDYGLLGGLEYKISNKFSLNARAQLGLKNMVLVHPNTPPPNVSYQVQALQLGFNYRLENKKNQWN